MQCNNTLIFIYNIYYKILNVFYYITATTTKTINVLVLIRKCQEKFRKKETLIKTKR